MKQFLTFSTYILLVCYCISAVLELLTNFYTLIPYIKLVFFSLGIIALKNSYSFRFQTAFFLFGVIAFLKLPFLKYSDLYVQTLFVDLLEHAFILTLPFIIFLWNAGRKTEEQCLRYLRIALGLTFIGHAFYASGLFVEPYQFTYILSYIFNGNELNNPLLTLIFYSDLLVGLGLIVKFYEWKFLLYYTVIWLFVSTIARVFTFYPKEITGVNLLYFFSIISWRIVYIAFPLILIKKNRTM